MSAAIKVVVVGCGHMGSSHARAYHKLGGFELVGLVDRTPALRNRLARELGGVAEFDTLEAALEATQPDAVSVNTYPDTHKEFIVKALNDGRHVFTEKPLAVTVADARAVADLAKEQNLKVVVGYILRVHPAWMKFIEEARTLGSPLVMRMNLNQQSKGPEWETHKRLLGSMSPIVDCGVHYVDVMCQMTLSKPVRVQAIGAHLTDEVEDGMYNYGQLQVVFEDGSVGWYEAGWGPMMSETAYFVKDVIGPKGSVSIADSEAGASDDIDSHTKVNFLRRHYAELDGNGDFVKKDLLIDTRDDPGHQELCDREQAYFLKAIREDLDLTDHLEDAVNSLRIVLAADESVRTGQVVNL